MKIKTKKVQGQRKYEVHSKIVCLGSKIISWDYTLDVPLRLTALNLREEVTPFHFSRHVELLQHRYEVRMDVGFI